MDQCPLCESFVRVGGDTPCYVCGLSLIEVANDKTIAIVPGWLLFDPAKPKFAEPGLLRLLQVTENMILDFSQVGFLNSAGIGVLVALNTAKKRSGLKLVFAHVGPNVMEVFRICRLNKVLRIVEDIDKGLDIF